MRVAYPESMSRVLGGSHSESSQGFTAEVASTLGVWEDGEVSVTSQSDPGYTVSTTLVNNHS